MRLALALLTLVVAYAEAPGSVTTEAGRVAGSGNDVRVFKGIPYAAPPIGNLRWKAPQSPPHWEGIRKAIEFGPPCPQPAVLTMTAQSEDCLTLNVWTPARTAREKLPVLVSIPGGGFVGGWSGMPVYDGTGMAGQGLVYVTMNYRLGVFGFLAHPDLSKESPYGASGNYALLDLIAALEWVQRNIAAFGGDPRRVTIMGESAGGSAVCLLLASPLTKGLFQGAIAQSAHAQYLPIPHRTHSWFGIPPAEGMGRRLGSDVTALRELSAGELLKKLDSGPGMPRNGEFQAIVDGYVLPDDPASIFDSGKGLAVPVIAGTNSDDGFALFRYTRVSTVPEYQGFLSRRFGDLASRVFEFYPAASDKEASGSARQVITDANFLYGTRAVLFALAHARRPVYWYHFTRREDMSRKLGAPGAVHGAELRYVYGDLTKSLFVGTPFESVIRVLTSDDTDRMLVGAMNGAWVQFVKTGNPNGKGLPKWPALNRKHPEYMEYGDRAQIRRQLRDEQMAIYTKCYDRLRSTKEGLNRPATQMELLGYILP